METVLVSLRARQSSSMAAVWRGALSGSSLMRRVSSLGTMSRAGEGGADQGVGLVVGAGVAGVGDDRTGEGSRGVERGDADGVVDQFRFGVEDCWPGLTSASGSWAGIAWCA